ncbi:hypothetical protein AVEN_235107-1 [Araneus ventricosus]|uniref:Uncharacterized protein n=1 Tax=Araneus ventricosus TaxID=182803 RepID=A0A4Y2Q1R2_ARAVE|nr:hypothetical protein AVEN_235107-1 [Araneus ventricosus]
MRMAWCHSTPFHFSTHPFRWIIHGRSSQTEIPSAMGHSDPLLHLLLPLKNANHRLLRFPLESVLLPMYIHRSHFSFYGPAVQIERLDIQTRWKSKLSTTPHQFS